MNNKGFVFVETIIVTVILTSSLLLLYSTFYNILQSEKTRVYYDDINYIYRSQYLKRELLELPGIEALYSDFTESSNREAMRVIGIDNIKNVVSDSKAVDHFMNMYNDYEVRQIILLKDSYISKIQNECIKKKNYSADGCLTLYGIADDNLMEYFESMYIYINTDYVLLFEYTSCDLNNNCRNYYSWVSVKL